MSSQENQQNLEFYPPRLWGLDPLFSARVKLNIEDVLKVPVYPEHYQGVSQTTVCSTCMYTVQLYSLLQVCTAY